MQGSSPWTTQGAHCYWTFGVYLQLRCCGLSTLLSRGSRCARLPWNGSGLKINFQYKACISHPWKNIAHSISLHILSLAETPMPHWLQAVFMNCPRARSVVQVCEAAFSAVLAWSKSRARCRRSKVTYKQPQILISDPFWSFCNVSHGIIINVLNLISFMMLSILHILSVLHYYHIFSPSFKDYDYLLTHYA